MTTSTATHRERVEKELAVVRGEIGRTDTKASILLASVALVAGSLFQHASELLHQPWPITVLTVLAAASTGVAGWLLLDVVLPWLNGSGRSNFLHYARCDREELGRLLGAEADLERELMTLSQIAITKYQRLARAGKLLKLSGLLFTATAALALAT